MAARADLSYLATYNSLLDEHLGEYLSRPAIRRHLRRQGLIKAGGVVVGEDEWRAVVQKREAKEKMDRDNFEQQRCRVRREERVRMEAKRKHRQQLQDNFGVADRIRLQAERHHPAYVRERNFAPLSRGDSHALGIRSTAVVPDRDLVTTSVATKSSQSRVSSSLRSVYRDSPYTPRPPNRSSPTKENFNIPTNPHRRKMIRQVNGGTPHVQSKTTITLLYRGRGIKLNGKTIQESHSEVCVYQQHCGGNAVLVYQGYLAPGTRFSFLSRRHLDSTLGLTFYLSGLVDARLSACCEYRYKQGHRVGGAGRTCHYEWVSAKNATPCARCQADVEVDNLIVVGGSAVSTKQPDCNTNIGIREAWVNTSMLCVNPHEAGYSSSEFDEVSNAASIPEDNVLNTANTLEDTEYAVGVPDEVLESVSRRSSVSTTSDGTSSVSLDSDLDESQSDTETRLDSAVSNNISSPSRSSRAYTSSLGHVTPDDRLLAPSALTGISPSISEDVIGEMPGFEDLTVSTGTDVSATKSRERVVQVPTHISSEDNARLESNTEVRSVSVATNTPADVTISSSLSMVTTNDSIVPVECIEPYTITRECLVVSRNITDTELEELVLLLQDNTIHSLVLENTRNFTPNHLETILNHANVIKTIQLTHTELSEDQFAIILNHLKEIESLEISHSVIHPDHFTSFINKLVKTAQKLANFNTSGCDIHFDTSIIKSLKSLENLTHVNLSRNVLKSAITYDSLHHLNLKELHLDDTNLQESDLLELCNFLCTNTTVHTLSLRDNHIPTQVLQKILDMLQENRTIKQLFFTPSTTDESQTQHINIKLITDILEKRVI